MLKKFKNTFEQNKNAFNNFSNFVFTLEFSSAIVVIVETVLTNEERLVEAKIVQSLFIGCIIIFLSVFNQNFKLKLISNFVIFIYIGIRLVRINYVS